MYNEEWDNILCDLVDPAVNNPSTGAYNDFFKSACEHGIPVDYAMDYLNEVLNER